MRITASLEVDRADGIAPGTPRPLLAPVMLVELLTVPRTLPPRCLLVVQITLWAAHVFTICAICTFSTDCADLSIASSVDFDGTPARAVVYIIRSNCADGCWH